MFIPRSIRPLKSALAASIALGALCTAPSYAGQILDALPADAQQDAVAVMEYAVAFDACPQQAYFDQANAYVVQLLATDIQSHPRFAQLPNEGKRALLFGLVRELQEASKELPAPDCATDALAARDAFIQRLAMRAEQNAASADRSDADQDSADQNSADQGANEQDADQPGDVDQGAASADRSDVDQNSVDQYSADQDAEQSGDADQSAASADRSDADQNSVDQGGSDEEADEPAEIDQGGVDELHGDQGMTDSAPNAVR